MTTERELLALADKIMARCTVSHRECWEWSGAHHQSGYGQVWVPALKKLQSTHRVMYEIYKGNIPAGLHIDHLCRNPKCCNPDHLEAVTPRENTIRGDAGAKAKLAGANQAYCRNGHERTAKNTYTRKDGRKQCRVCSVNADMSRRMKNLALGLTQEGSERQRSVYRRHMEALNG